MYKIHSRKVVQKIFVYWISFSSDFHYNFRGVLLQKTLLPQHLIVKKSHQGAQYSFQGLFCICQHAISVHLISPHGLCNASQVNKQLKMILHMHSLPSTHTVIYTKANFHFISADLTKHDYSERAWPGPLPRLVIRKPLLHEPQTFPMLSMATSNSWCALSCKVLFRAVELLQ